MARRILSVKVPEGYQAGQTFQVELPGSGVTGHMKAYAKAWQAKGGPDADDFDAMFWRYHEENPNARARTMMTALGQAWES